MSRFVVRAQGAWLVTPIAVKGVVVLTLLALLMLLAAVPVFAGQIEPNPFRWI